MSISESTVVSVTVNVNQASTPQEGQGVINIVTDETSIPTGNRLRFYQNMTQVGADWATSTRAYAAAAQVFSQNPAPNEIAISRAFLSATSGYLQGEPVTAALSAFNAITAGTLSLSIDGVAKNLTALNFSAAANLNAVAATLQTALNTSVSGTTCVFNGSAFVITSPTTGTNSAISFPTTSGADISSTFGLLQSEGAVIFPGYAVETVTQALANIKAYNSAFQGIFITLAGETTQNLLDASAWANSNQLEHAFTGQTSDIPASGTSDICSQMKALGYDRTIMQYDPASPYSVLSLLARAYAVDYTQPNSTITLKFKQEPGITVLNITDTQRLTLESKNCNYYTSVGGNPMIAQGISASGRFIDEVLGLDYFAQFMQETEFAALYAVGKIQQTDKGCAKLVQAANVACDEMVANGFIAPGYWNGNPIGNIQTGDYLPKGYYNYIAPVANQTSGQRAARVAPPLTTICIGAGAIHNVNVALNFQR